MGSPGGSECLPLPFRSDLAFLPSGFGDIPGAPLEAMIFSVMASQQWRSPPVCGGPTYTANLLGNQPFDSESQLILPRTTQITWTDIPKPFDR